VTLENLDEDSLVAILTEPRNALIRQYEYLFNIDDVKLEVQEDAIRAIAKKAIEQETGARGLRAIVENFMTDIMYELPSDESITKCVITKEVVEDSADPIVTKSK
ncbi:MAG: ATP-dependent Clp protease ATP-binding subunit ClpX, partial [bacterium]